MALLLNGIKFVVIRGNQWEVQSFSQRQCEGVGKTHTLFHFDDPDSLDKFIIAISSKLERQG
jgi:hypothetical protein